MTKQAIILSAFWGGISSHRSREEARPEQTRRGSHSLATAGWEPARQSGKGAIRRRKTDQSTDKLNKKGHTQIAWKDNRVP